MAKKKGKVGGKHAQQSFPQMVAQAAMNVVKPYVEELMGSMANDLSQRVFRQLANIQTRVMAAEEILQEKLGVTEADIQTKVAQVEDDATGYVQKAEAEEGDLVRISLKTKAKDSEWSKLVKRQVTRLLKAPYSLGSEVVERAIVGMKTGETKLVTLEDDFLVELTIDRISAKPKPVTPEAPSVQNQDA